jgi:transposase
VVAGRVDEHGGYGAGACGIGADARQYGTLVIVWGHGHAERWVLLTADLAPRQVEHSWYGLRMWIELGFRALKGVGWQWQRTRRTDPERVARHWLVLAVATLWAPIGAAPVVRVDAGRSTTHFYGTLNLQTGREIVTRSDAMNSDATAQHLQALLDASPDQPILLLWDRAPWHQGAAVRQVLTDNPRLEVARLPTASPDLNPQEQVWKATRQTVSHNHTMPRLPALADQFEAYLCATTFPSSFLARYGYHMVCPMLR